MDFKEITREHMEKAEQYIQSEDIRNADMNELVSKHFYRHRQ